MLLRRISLVTITLVSLLVTSVKAQENPGLVLMNRMVEAFSTLSYEGVFVRSHDSHMNSMQVRHSVIDGVEYESLLDLDGEKIEVIRIDDSVICVYPNMSFANNADPITTPFKRFEEFNGERLLKGYNFVVTKQGLVAGRRAQKLELRPRDQYRYGHEFWLDIETGFLLKHDTLKSSGKILDRVQFTSLNVSPNLSENDFVPRMGTYAEHVIEVTPKSIPSHWVFDWLPAGFAPVWRGARQINDNASMMLLSDGMTSVSIFIESTKESKPLTVMSMGSTIAGEKTSMMNGKPFLLTAVGEVPDATIRKLLSVIMPRQK